MKKASFFVTDGIPGIAAKDEIIRNAVMPQERRRCVSRLLNEKTATSLRWGRRQRRGR